VKALEKFRLRRQTTQATLRRHPGPYPCSAAPYAPFPVNDDPPASPQALAYETAALNPTRLSFAYSHMRVLHSDLATSVVCPSDTARNSVLVAGHVHAGSAVS